MPRRKMFFVFVLFFVCSFANAQSSVFESVIPAQSTLGKFAMKSKKYVDNKSYDGLVLLFRNEANGQQMLFNILRAKDGDKANMIAKGFINTPGGKMPTGSFSGRKICDEQWHSTAKNPSSQDSVMLVVRSKNFIIMSSLMNQPVKINNKWVRKPLTFAEVGTVENVVAESLDKARKNGLAP